MEKIAVYIMNKDNVEDMSFDFTLNEDESLVKTENYFEGLYSDDPDLKSYDQKWGISDE